jgi:hypothetical protein
MSWPEQIRAFEYEKAVWDLGFQPGPDLWTYLDNAAASRSMAETQMIQDLSWVMTQLDLASRELLEQCRNAIHQTLAEAYGADAPAELAKVGVTPESFLLPIAKTAMNAGQGDIADYLRTSVPSPRFVGLFVKWWVSSRASIHSADHRRVWMADPNKTCAQCNNEKIVSAAMDAAVDAVRDAARERMATGASGSSNIDEELKRKLLNFVACRRCRGSGINDSYVEELANRVQSGMATNAQRQSFLRLAQKQQQHRLTPLDVAQELGPDSRCPQCLGIKVDPAKCSIALLMPLPANPNRSITDLLRKLSQTGGIPIQEFIDLLGDDILCPACGVWIPSLGEGSKTA